MIDLEELREAMGGPMGIPERQRVRRVAIEALLDAPKVWWCEWGYQTKTEGCERGLHHQPGFESACGWRLLVPVKEEA